MTVAWTEKDYADARIYLAAAFKSVRLAAKAAEVVDVPDAALEDFCRYRTQQIWERCVRIIDAGKKLRERGPDEEQGIVSQCVIGER